MRLVVDASVLVGELLRRAGRERLGDERLELFLPEHTWDEVRHEVPKRAQRLGERRGLDDGIVRQLVAACLEAVIANVTIVAVPIYAPMEQEARWRSARDERDWPSVALALVLDAAVWTEDADFLGTGVPTWTTETVKSWLKRGVR
jgi:predicted nucleic acid-binding protein